MLDGNGMICIDGGDTQAWTDSSYIATKPGRYVKGGPLGCMGVGVPLHWDLKLHIRAGCGFN